MKKSKVFDCSVWVSINRRRAELILKECRRKVSGLNVEEAKELSELQDFVGWLMDLVWPLRSRPIFHGNRRQRQAAKKAEKQEQAKHKRQAMLKLRESPVWTRLSGRLAVLSSKKHLSGREDAQLGQLKKFSSCFVSLVGRKAG